MHTCNFTIEHFLFSLELLVETNMLSDHFGNLRMLPIYLNPGVQSIILNINNIFIIIFFNSVNCFGIQFSSRFNGYPYYYDFEIFLYSLTLLNFFS